MTGHTNLTVVVVAFGEPESLRLCLGAVAAAYPTVVVDNSSSSEVEAVVRKAGAEYLDPGANLGFAAAVNCALAGIELRKRDILLLNPDAVIEPAAVELLRTRLLETPDAACVAPAQTDPGGDRTARVGWPFPTPLGAWVEAAGLGGRRRSEYAIGAVLLLRGSALRDVGGLDERFFLYAEETDWQRRARDRSWVSCVCDDVWATHIGAGTDSNQRRRELRFHSAAERYIRKHHGRTGWQTYRLAILLGAVGRAVVLRDGRGRAAMWRAWIYAVGPDRLATACGFVPKSVSHIPSLADDSSGARDGDNATHAHQTAWSQP